MKKQTKIFTVIFIIVVIIAAAILILKNIDDKNKDKIFSIENIDDIDKIFMVDKSNNSVLLEKDGSFWTVDGRYYAMDEQVRNLLAIVRKLQVREPVSRSSYDNVISLLATKGKKVEFYGKGYKIDFLGIKLFPVKNKLLKAFYVGESTKDSMGTYMINEGSNRPYVVYIPGYRGYVSPYFTTDPASWRAHIVFNYRIPQISSFRYIDNEYPKDSYVIENPDSRNFILKTYPDNIQVPYDTLRMIDLMSSFANIRYEYLFSETDTALVALIDSIKLTEPAHVLTLIDKYGEETTVKTYRLWYYNYELEDNDYDRDRLYAWVNKPSRFTDENGNVLYDDDFVMMQYFSFDAVLRPLHLLKSRN
ncbi:MAG: DUF4340 domain-containing protein [Bacteroidales bacterium]|jgi:hypothetical protein|nr:DUF4340 domain-containing protein [Bacteroidales bacterium]